MPLTATEPRSVVAPAIALALRVLDQGAAASDWNVLAYEVELKGRGGVTLSKQDFEDCVANFKRFGQVPVVLFHADTDPSAHPDAAMARGWITALRVGSMERKGKTVATLEGRLALDAETKALVNADPPRLAFGSITILQNAVDEESGERIGAYLYSYSLTNRPALTDVPRLAASQRLPSESATDPGRCAEKETTTMADTKSEGAVELRPVATFLPLAARIGIVAGAEDDAERKITALASEAVEHRATLGLAAHAPAGEVSAKLTALVNDAAKLTVLEKELETLREESNTRAREAATEEVAQLVACGAIANDAKARAAAVDLRVKHPEQFAAMFAGKRDAKSKRAELMGKRIAPVGGTAPASMTNAEPLTGYAAFTAQCESVARELMNKDSELSYENALSEASRQIKRGTRAVRS